MSQLLTVVGNAVDSTHGDKETSGLMFHSHLARAPLVRAFLVSLPPAPRCRLRAPASEA